MFGKQLRKIRMEKHITQQRLADSVGIALRSYQCYEQGTREPSLYLLTRLADELDVSADVLLERDDFLAKHADGFQ